MGVVSADQRYNTLPRFTSHWTHFLFQGLQITWIGCAALAFYTCTCLLAVPTPPVQPFLPVLLFFGTIFGYHFAQPDIRWRAYAWCCGAVAFFAWLQIDLKLKIGIFIPLLIWGAYYGWQWPRKKGLRWQTSWKTPAVAFAWAWMGVVLPFFPYFPLSLAVLFGSRFLFIGALALAYDLHDRRYDAQRGLITLVARLGAARSLQLIYLLFFGAAILDVLYAASTARQGIFFIAILCAYAFDMLLMYGLFRTEKPYFWRKMAIDGLIVFQALLLYLAQRV